nr:immunoglobulin heavy chain junction region [Mus musculus]
CASGFRYAMDYW